MSGPDSFDDPDSPEEEPRGPTRYDEVPAYRRNDFCSGILLAHVCVMFLGACVPFLSLFGIITVPGVIVVCVVVLTGPVYYDKRRKDGSLKTWSRGNKIAAAILLLIFVVGYGALIYYLIANGKFG